ncbi:acyltransferase [Methylobacterium sp. BTF04]|uniref:acyltransferase family protein n=1 Tax=Methylobacterium sp. BTF04 TaxID=2708300 RepID=UPI0013D86092|nr:acyltransferase [Methylobacterium sp. BTF04]NEU13486.1 acyltransferase [Methylobacterium sp. BTF04]
MSEAAYPRPVFDGEVHSLQFLRFAAALMVVVFHAGFAARQYGFLGPAYDGVLNASEIGKSGVHIFFVISGFIMVYATRRSERDWRAAGTFFYRRFARIYPIYWIYCGLYAVFHASVLRPYDLDAGKVMEAVLLIPGSSSAIIGPGWTLSYEVYFYVCFAACIPLGARASLKVLTVSMLAAMLLGGLIEGEGPVSQVLTSTLLIEFLAGVWIAVFVATDRPFPALLPPVALTAGIVGLVAPAIVDVAQIPTVILWGVPSALLVLGLAVQERQQRTPGFVRRLSSLGNASYSLYLLHNLILDGVFVALVAAGTPHRFGWAWTVLAVACCCAVSGYAYRWIEHPLHGALIQSRRLPTRVTAI